MGSLRGRPGIPNGLANAIELVQKQYCAIPLRAEEWPQIDGKGDLSRSGFLPILPKPTADESWAVGGRIAFKDPSTEETKFEGEVTDFDPDSGQVIVDVSEWPDWQSAPKHLRQENA